MTSKERVHATLSRKPVDRVPVFMWFHPDTTKILSKVLEISPSFVSEAMGDDIMQTWVGNNYAMEGIVHENDGESHTDFWDIGWVKEGPFNQIRRYPLKDASDRELENYRYPFERIDELLGNMLPLFEWSSEKFIGCDVSPSIFEMICRLTGMEQALLDFAAFPERAKKMCQDAANFNLELANAACERFTLDWLWTGDDVGGQQAMMMSPDTWREFIKPLLKEIFTVGKSNQLWVAYHSCGAIRPIIPDLVEMGLDVLNPIQCNCPGMDPLELKKEFGRDLTFMGGVDTQELLPKGSIMDVQKGTEKLLNGMSGGGYILAASHTVPPETPLENIFAMYELAGISRQEIFDRSSDIRQREETIH